MGTDKKNEFTDSAKKKMADIGTKMGEAIGDAKDQVKPKAKRVVHAAKRVAVVTGDAVSKQVEHVQQKLEDKKQEEIDAHNNEVNHVMEGLAGTLAGQLIAQLGDSPVILDKKRIEQIKKAFPIPREQTILWADAEFDLRPSGIAVTNAGVFIKSDVKVFEKDKSKSKPVLYYYPWDSFEPEWFTEIADENKALSVDTSCCRVFINACKSIDKSSSVGFDFKKLNTVNDPQIGEKVAKVAPLSVAGIQSSESAVFSEQKSSINTPAGHGEMAEEAITYLDKLFGNKAVVVGRDNAKDGADRLVNGTYIQTKYYNSATGSLEACFAPNKGNYRYMNPDGTPMQLEVPKDQYEKVLSGFKNKIKNGQVPGVTNPDEAENIVRQGRLTYKQAVNLTKPGTIESLAYDAATGSIICSCAFGISFVTAMYFAWRSTKDIKQAIQTGVESGIQVFGISFLQHMVVSQIGRTSLSKTLIKPSQYLVEQLGYKASATLVNGIRALSGKAPIYGAAASKQLAKIFRNNVLTSAITLVVFSVPETYSFASKKITNAQYIKNMASLVGSVLGGTGGALAAGVAASKIAGAAGTAVAPGVGTAVGIAGGFVGGFAGAKAVDVVGNILHESDIDTISRLFNAYTSCMVNEYMLDDEEIDQFIEAMNKVPQKQFRKLFTSIQQSANQESVIREFLAPVFDGIVSERDYFQLPSEEEMDSAFLQIEKTFAETEQQTDKADYSDKDCQPEKCDIMLFPSTYEKLEIENFEDLGIPEDATVYRMCSDSSSGLLLLFTVTEEESMPFDNPQQVIDELHETMGENEGLIEVNTGITNNNHPFVYDIIKRRTVSDEGIPTGVDYTLNLNIKLEDSIQFINASFIEDGTTGVRDNIVLFMYAKKHEISPSDAMKTWFSDPYDDDYKKGFLMNRSEQPVFDEQFPHHPLSEARSLINFIKEHN